MLRRRASRHVAAEEEQMLTLHQANLIALEYSLLDYFLLFSVGKVYGGYL